MHAYLRVEGLDEALLGIPSAIDAASARFLGAGNGDGVRLALARLLSQFLGTREVNGLL